MKSKKASSRVTSANQESAAAAAAASRSTKRKAIENVAKRQFEKTASKSIQAHTRASGQRRQARRDSR
jgi:hypothetical protein